MTPEKRVEQYLERYVLAESRNAAQLVLNSTHTRFARTLCIPMYDETLAVVKRAIAHPSIQGTLLILVINAPDNAPRDTYTRTLHLLDQVTTLGDEIAHDQHNALRIIATTAGTVHVLVMDHCSQGRQLPAKEGVGRARKLGADAALELWHKARVDDPWLYQSDADVTFPENYFDTPDALENCAAIHLNFRHDAEGPPSLEQQLYDLKLDHYVAGLAHAGSPYAHYSLGSALVIDCNAYVAVRGFPRRSAGEDFYLLSKIAKLGTVGFDITRTLSIAERLSSRVPFGTGPGVRQFRDSNDTLTDEAYYAPRSFQALKRWLAFLDEVVAEPSEDSQTDVRTDYLTRTLLESHSTEIRALDQLQLFAWTEKIRSRYSSSAQRRHQLATGMDALRTLQFIHTLRDFGYHNVTPAEALLSLETFRSSLSDAPRRLRSNSYRGLIVF